jgi:hypothetical protein
LLAQFPKKDEVQSIIWSDKVMMTRSTAKISIKSLWFTSGPRRSVGFRWRASCRFLDERHSVIETLRLSGRFMIAIGSWWYRTQAKL